MAATLKELAERVTEFQAWREEQDELWEAKEREHAQILAEMRARA